MTPPITLLFYRGSGLAGWLVRTWTRSRFAHVAVRVGDNVYEAVWSGVRCRPRRDTDMYGRAKGDVAVPLSNVDAAAAEAWLKAQVGKPYNRAAVVVSALSRFAPHYLRISDVQEGEYDCSLLGEGVVHADASHLRGPMSPGDLYDLVTAKH